MTLDCAQVDPIMDRRPEQFSGCQRGKEEEVKVLKMDAGQYK